MKWYHSIIARITLIFALALIGIAAIFVFLARHENAKDAQTMFEYSHLALKTAYDQIGRAHV